MGIFFKKAVLSVTKVHSMTQDPLVTCIPNLQLMFIREIDKVKCISSLILPLILWFQ